MRRPLDHALLCVDTWICIIMFLKLWRGVMDFCGYVDTGRWRGYLLSNRRSTPLAYSDSVENPPHSRKVLKPK